jgi:hypothetical protein
VLSVSCVPSLCFCFPNNERSRFRGWVGEVGIVYRSPRCSRRWTGMSHIPLEGLGSFPDGVRSCPSWAFLLLGVVVSVCLDPGAASARAPALKLVLLALRGGAVSLRGSGVGNMRGGSGARYGTSEDPELSERYSTLFWLSLNAPESRSRPLPLPLPSLLRPRFTVRLMIQQRI